MILTAEKLDSWYEPKKVTVEEEKVMEDVCDLCGGTGEVETYTRDESTGYNWIADDVKPCLCQINNNEE